MTQRTGQIGLLLHATLVLLLVGATELNACNVPVFRYALERWKPDLYDVTFFHEGPLPGDLSALLDLMRKRDAHGRMLTNLRVKMVDVLGAMDDTERRLWEGQENATTPWMVIEFPKGLQLEKPMWAGRANMDSVSVMLDSPARKMLRELLLDGTSTVWLVIASGVEDQDSAAMKSLERELKKLEGIIKLPDESARPGGVLTLPNNEGEGLLSKVPLRMDFQLLKVDRNDPRESAFLANILRTDEGLSEEKGVIVVPVFGRGRALQAFPGQNLEDKAIAETEEFLCGACSCSVKALNPGMDLLLTAAWESTLGVGRGGEDHTGVANNRDVTSELDVAKSIPIPPGARRGGQAEIVDESILASGTVVDKISPPSGFGGWIAAMVAGLTAVALGILAFQFHCAKKQKQ